MYFNQVRIKCFKNYWICRKSTHKKWNNKKVFCYFCLLFFVLCIFFREIWMFLIAPGKNSFYLALDFYWYRFQWFCFFNSFFFLFSLTHFRVGFFNWTFSKVIQTLTLYETNSQKPSLKLVPRGTHNTAVAHMGFKTHSYRFTFTFVFMVKATAIQCDKRHVLLAIVRKR